MQNSVLERRNQLKRIIYASAILLLLTTIYLSVNFFDKWTLHQRDNQGSESMNYYRVNINNNSAELYIKCKHDFIPKKLISKVLEYFNFFSI